MIVQGFEFEFDEESHTYIIDGIIVPSITQIIKRITPDKYVGVDASVLARAAQRGTDIHKEIEDYCVKGIRGKTMEFENFVWLQNKYPFIVIDNEVPILITENGKPKAAGRLDLILDVEGEISIADIKTTAVLDRLYLLHQLNLYRIGYMQSYGVNISKVFGMHLRGDKRKLVEIPVNENVALNDLKTYTRMEEMG